MYTYIWLHRDWHDVFSKNSFETFTFLNAIVIVPRIPQLTSFSCERQKEASRRRTDRNSAWLNDLIVQNDKVKVKKVVV